MIGSNVEIDVVALNWEKNMYSVLGSVDSAQYGIYFLPTSRRYNVVFPSQNRNLFIVSRSSFSFAYARAVNISWYCRLTFGPVIGSNVEIDVVALNWVADVRKQIRFADRKN